MPRPPEFVGRVFTIECLELADGSVPVGEFLDELEESGRRKLKLLFEMLGDLGKVPNNTKFKKLEGSDEIWEFKSYQIRIFSFFTPGRRVLLAHA